MGVLPRSSPSLDIYSLKILFPKVPLYLENLVRQSKYMIRPITCKFHYDVHRLYTAGSLSFLRFSSLVVSCGCIGPPSLNIGQAANQLMAKELISMRKAQSIVQSTVQSIVHSPGFVVSPDWLPIGCCGPVTCRVHTTKYVIVWCAVYTPASPIVSC